MSIFSGILKSNQYFLDKPVVNAITLADSSVNWDIAVPSDAEVPVQEAADTSSPGISVSLNSLKSETEG